MQHLFHLILSQKFNALYLSVANQAVANQTVSNQTVSKWPKEFDSKALILFQVEWEEGKIKSVLDKS